MVNSALGVKVVVATFAKVLTPLKYGRLPMTAAVEVASPPHVMFGVVPPEEIIGHVPVTAVTVPPPAVEVATQPMPLVVLFQPRTYPPAGAVPYKVEVAIGAVFPVAAFPRTPADCEPYDVVLPTEVTTPERFALVVTVPALPPMLRDEVATSRSAVPAEFV